MSASDLSQLIRAIELDDMTTYLGANGWKRDEGFSRVDVLRFLLSLIHISEPTRPY